MAGLSDAASDRASVAQAPALGSFSVCAWIKPTSSAAFSPLVRVEAGGGSALIFGLKSLAPSLYSGASTTGINGTSIGTGTYTFVAATRNGTACALYFGTNPASLTKVTGTVNSTGTPDTWTVWGRSPSDASEWFPGVIAYLRSWAGTVLTDAEVAAEGASATAIKAGTWSNHPFGDNGSGGVSLNDVSGNARHLVAGTTPLTLVADPSFGPVAGALSMGTTAAVSLGAFTDRTRSLAIAATAQVATSPVRTTPGVLSIGTSAQVNLGAFANRAGALSIAATTQLAAAPVRETPGALVVATTAQVALALVRATPGALAVGVTSQLGLVPFADRTAALDATSTAELQLVPSTDRTAALAMEVLAHASFEAFTERPAALAIGATAQLDLVPAAVRAGALSIASQAQLQLVAGGAIPGTLSVAATAQLVATTVRSTPGALSIDTVAAVTLAAEHLRLALLAIASRAQLDVVPARVFERALAIAVRAALLLQQDEDHSGSLLLDVGRPEDRSWIRTGPGGERTWVGPTHAESIAWLITNSGSSR